MPKEKSKELKRKNAESPQNTNNVGTFHTSPLKKFVKMHSKRINQCNEKILDATEQYEQLKLFEIDRNSKIEELKKSLDEKSNALVELTLKYEKLQQDNKNLKHTMLVEQKRFTDVEVIYDQNCHTLQEQIQALIEEKKNAYIQINAKEVECAVYLKDIRTQLDNVNIQNAEIEQQKAVLQSNIVELENQLQQCKTESAEKENIIQTQKDDLSKKEKKLHRKNKDISSLEHKLKTLQKEKGDLKKLLEIEGLKIRELQRVLERPYNRISPVRDQNEIANQSIAQVEPITEENSIRSSTSPEIVLNTQIKVVRPQPENVQQQLTAVDETVQSVVPTVPVAILSQKPAGYPEQSENSEDTQNGLIANEVMESIDRQMEEWNQTESLSSFNRMKTSQKEKKKHTSTLNDDSILSDDGCFPPYRPTINYNIQSDRMDRLKALKRSRK